MADAADADPLSEEAEALLDGKTLDEIEGCHLAAGFAE